MATHASHEAFLALQLRWAEVLHNYKTKHLALQGRFDARLKNEEQLLALFEARKQAFSVEEQAAITRMIHDKLVELGYPPEPDAPLMPGGVT